MMAKIVKSAVIGISFISICAYGSSNCANMSTNEVDWGGEIQFEMPTNIVGKINESLEKLPNLEVEITSQPYVSVGGKQWDCCDSGAVNDNGVHCVEVTMGVTGSVSGNLWGYNYEAQKTISIIGKQIDVSVEATIGVPVNMGIDLTVSGGYTDDDCIPDEWPWGGANLNMTPSIAATINSELCFKIGDRSKTFEIDFTPAQLDMSLTGEVGYNKKKEKCGAYGEAALNDIIFTATIDLPGLPEYSWSYEIYPEPGVVD